MLGSSVGVFPPLFSTVGGVVSQEVLKALTGKFTPLSQFVRVNLRFLGPQTTFRLTEVLPQNLLPVLRQSPTNVVAVYNTATNVDNGKTYVDNDNVFLQTVVKENVVNN